MGKENPGNAVNLLCEGTVIVGDIKTKNDIRIDGIIKGKIITSGILVVGNTAKIEGNIDCCNVDVLGVVLGDIQASGTVSLKSSAKSDWKYCFICTLDRTGSDIQWQLPNDKKRGA